MELIQGQRIEAQTVPARGTFHFLQSVGLMPFQPSDWDEFPSQIH